MAGLTSGEKAQLAKAKRRIAQLHAKRRAIEPARAVVAPQRRFEAVKVMAAEGIPVQMACRVLEVLVSSSDDWRSRRRSPGACRAAAWPRDRGRSQRGDDGDAPGRARWGQRPT
jgi:hypothetical protein